MRSHRNTNFIIKLIFSTLLWIVFFTYNIPDTNDYPQPYYPTPIIEETPYPLPEPIDTTPPIHLSPEDQISTLYNLFEPYRAEEKYTTITSETQQQHIDRICGIFTSLCESIVFTDPSTQDTMILRITLWTIIQLQEDRRGDTIWFKSLHWIHIKNDPTTSRWYANHNHIVINYANMTLWEYKEVLTHEIGHIVDLWVIKWSWSLYNRLYTEFNKIRFLENDPSLLFYALSRQSETTKTLWSNKYEFCGLYALKNPFEDRAECFNLYINHNEYFQSLASKNPILQQKYNFIAQWFDMPSSTRHTDIPYKRSNLYRYRDTTKIANAASSTD